MGDEDRMAYGTGSSAEMADQPAGLAQLIIGLYNSLGETAKKAIGNSQTAMETGYYNPAPVVDAALTAMSGGVAGTGRGGVALGSGMSFPLYHGSPKAGLKEILPSERGALGPGTYFTPAENVAARYGDNVYELPTKERNIFNGLGDRYGSYEGWKADKEALLKAVEPEKRAELQAILDKMWMSDGYPMHARIAGMYRDEAKAQALYKRAGFEGFAGHADGPEVVLFGKQDLGR